MFSLGELIEHTRHQLSGLDASKDAVSALSLAATDTETTLSLDDMSGAAVGIAEIDFEQVRIRAVASTDGTVRLWPFGRGYRGTTATAHNVGSEVRFNPSWPASTVARELNGVLVEVYPSIYAVKNHETTIPALGGQIDMPAGTVGVISVWMRDPVRQNDWLREDRWDFNHDASNTDHGLRIFGMWREGTAVRVVYAARPGLFNLSGTLSQDFTTTTGLDARCSDLLALGVARRLSPFIDVGKLPFIAAAAADAGEAKSPGAGGTATRLLHSLFLARLEQESAILTREHPIRVHRVR